MKMVIYITVVQLWTGRNMSDWFEGHKHPYQELSECVWGWRKRQSWELEVGDCWLTIDDGDEEVSPSWSSFSAVPVLLASQRKPGSLVWLRPSSDDDLRQKVKRKSLEFQVSLLSSKFLKFIELSAKHSMLVMWLHCVCVWLHFKALILSSSYRHFLTTREVCICVFILCVHGWVIDEWWVFTAKQIWQVLLLFCYFSSCSDQYHFVHVIWKWSGLMLF